MLKTYLLIFGAIILAGGFQGFLKGSKASLIASAILGGLVIAGLAWVYDVARYRGWLNWAKRGE